MFDEFFYRRRKSKGMFVLSILFIVLSIALIAGGILFLS